MRAGVWAIASTLATLAFHVSIVLYPEQLQHYSWALRYVWGISGLFLLMWAILYLQHKLESSSKPPPELVSSGVGVVPAASSVSHGGNANVTQHFHLGAPETVRVSAMPVSVRKKHIEIEILPVYSGYALAPQGRWEFTDREHGYDAAFLPIHLDAVKSDAGVELGYARVSLVFTDDDGNKIRIAHGCWIDVKTLDYVDISPGETKWVLLGAFSSAFDRVTAFSSNITDYGDYERKKSEPFETFPMPVGHYKLDVVLTWGGPGKQVFTIDVDFNEIVANIRKSDS